MSDSAVLPTLPRAPSAWLLTIAVALPLIWPFDPGVVAKMGTTLLACGLWSLVLALAAWDGLVPRPGWAAGGFLALAAVIGLQIGLGDIAYASQGGIAIAVLLAAALLAGLGRAAALRTRAETPNRDWVDAVTLGLIVQALIQVAMGLLQFGLWQWADLGQWLSTHIPGYSSIVSYPSTGRVFGNLRQPNHYATAVALGMAGLAWWAPRLRAGWVWLIAVSFAWALVVCGSRTGMVEVLAGSALVLAFVRGAWRQPRWAALAAMPLLYLGWWLVMRTLDHLGWVSFLDAVTRQLDQPVNARALIWRNAWQVFEHLPRLGSGWGQLGWGLQHAALHDALHPLPLDNIDNAHDLILELLSETGLVGTASTLGVGAVWLIMAVRAAFRAGRSDGSQGSLALAGWIGVAMLGLHSLVEYPLWYLYFLAPFALLTGWVEGVAPVTRPGNPAAAARWAAMAAGLAALLLTGKAVVDYGEINAVYAGTAGNAQIAAERHNWFFRPLVDFARASSLQVLAEDPPATLRTDLRLIDRVSHVYGDPNLLMRRTLLLARLGREHEAQRLARYTASAFWTYAPGLAKQLPEMAKAAGLRPEQTAPLLAALRAAPVIRRVRVPTHR